MVQNVEIRGLLEANGLSAYSTVIADSAYSLPTKEWILTDFKDYYQKIYLSTYQNEAWDCDNYAFMFFVAAQTCHAMTGFHPETGLAIGVIGYTKDSGEGHAINFALINENGNRVVVFVEPQTGKEVTLSETEKSNVLWIVI